MSDCRAAKSQAKQTKTVSIPKVKEEDFDILEEYNESFIQDRKLEEEIMRENEDFEDLL